MLKLYNDKKFFILLLRNKVQFSDNKTIKYINTIRFYNKCYIKFAVLCFMVLTVSFLRVIEIIIVNINNKM